MSELNAVGDQNNTSQVQMEPCEKPENVNTTQEIKELNSNVEISKEENKISEVTQNLNEICTNCVPELSVEQKNVSESQPEVKSENTEVKTEIKDENEVQNIAPVIKEKENPVMK